jgi:2-hydroxy-6-oxonona-2,4-dienedioate hydrolase
MGILDSSKGVGEHRWTTVNGWRTFARYWPGPVEAGVLPVVLVHGLSVSSRYMAPTAERLAAYTRVYALDLPGFGKSERPRQVLTIAELAIMLVEWMRQRGVNRSVLLGNSLGCQVIAHAALAAPELVARAILVGPTMDPRAGALAQVWRLLRYSAAEPVTYLPLLAYDYLSAGPRRTIRTFQHALRDRTVETYARMPAPTLVVRGERDPIVPACWAEELAALLPNGSLAVVPRAGHAVNFNAPDQLVRLVLPLLYEASGSLWSPSAGDAGNQLTG